ncbi:hypothetical protein B0H65DRAFT_123525 [Neurospora tetraspora]|uniref:Secreted protein n=1 Tax=Neurospora tetraspora TaxID=94610 RepID=A0AAE0JKS9_9PEZI|nr:hypothetical protein B0H65DRAFT_123525 [Neurospora tetraspora]
MIRHSRNGSWTRLWLLLFFSHLEVEGGFGALQIAMRPQRLLRERPSASNIPTMWIRQFIKHVLLMIVIEMHSACNFKLHLVGVRNQDGHGAR